MRVQKWRSFSELLPLDLFAEGVGAPTAKAIVSETRPPCNLGRAGFLLAGENTFSKCRSKLGHLKKCPLVFKSNPCLKFNTPKFLVNGKKIFCENFCRPAPLTKNFFGVFFISQGLAFKKLLRPFFYFYFFSGPKSHEKFLTRFEIIAQNCAMRTYEFLILLCKILRNSRALIFIFAPQDARVSQKF